MTTGALRPATHARHYREQADVIEPDGVRSWITRARNFTVILSEVKSGSVLARSRQPDEFMVLLPPGTAARIEANGDAVESDGDSLIIVPPGESRVIAKTAGMIVRIVSCAADDLLAKANNSATYADDAPEVAPLVPWPEPTGGFRLRHYRLADYPSPDPSPLKMRVFRSTNLMVNVFLPWTASRDETKLSPHSHEDFEQASIGLAGSFVHHIRYPWTSDKTAWRADEHEHHDSPSVLVIPARAIHTSQNVGNAVARLVDIFAPPRADFSLKRGFVLNEGEYPLPESFRG